MLEKLRQIENRYAELESKLADPAYYSDPAVFTKLCREQRELQPVVEAYRAYTACQAQIAQAEALLDDPELHEIAREEIEQGRARCAELEQQLRVLLLPRDPNDDRNVILEIRTGVGVIVNIPQRLADHQVHIKGQVAHLGQPGDHRRAKGDIGHKMPVHYIQVQQMSAPGGAFVGLCAHVGKIAGQHRR